MIFSYVRRRRREKMLAEPFPALWLTVLQTNVPYYHRLESDDQQRLQNLVRLMIAEKNWEGCGGLVLSDDIKVIIAAWACLLILHLEMDFYGRLITILVYTAAYAAANRFPGKKQAWKLACLKGQSSHDGVIVLNWGAIKNLSRTREITWCYIKFAHQFNSGDYDFNGIPHITGSHKNAQWREVIGEEYANLVAAARARQPTLLDKYGATNEAEFFAVASECFFLSAHPMSQQHPRLYHLLADYYRQDPAQSREVISS